MGSLSFYSGGLQHLSKEHYNNDNVLTCLDKKWWLFVVTTIDDLSVDVMGSVTSITALSSYSYSPSSLL